MYKHLFGPVPSRRLGMSLGIDLVPSKVCSLNCVYCEAGRTTDLTTERKEYISYDEVVKELNSYFQNNPDPDYLTFSGSGEPTLNSRIGDVISFLKKIKPDIPVAVITNGTLMSNPQLRRELLSASLMLPSLDAATETGFNKINRPANNLKLHSIIEGLADFRKEFKGKIWLEVFVLPNYNYSDNELFELNKAIIRINPDSVQLNTLDRPGTVDGLNPASVDQLEKIKNHFDHPNVEIIAAVHKKHKNQAPATDIENTILQMISRRPCTAEDLSETLNIHVDEVNIRIRDLLKEQKITANRLTRGIFYSPKNQ